MFQRPQVEKGGWRSGLILNKAKEPQANFANAIHALRTHPEWKGVLGWNEFTLQVVIHSPTPYGAQWFQRNGINVKANITEDAVYSAARERPFHPLREYLQGLEWDGMERTKTWLFDYLGVEDFAYTRAVGERWLISAVARVFEPGVKADHVLILEGKQGIGKSTVLEILAVRQEWFTDDFAQFGTKDASQGTKGVWIIELAELATMRKGEIEDVKSFVSRKIDRFRPPYGKAPESFPRECVFAGSVNPKSDGAYLRDETGNRRFWPVECHEMNTKMLERDRDQLWAEAVHSYRQGYEWHLVTPELIEAAQHEQEKRYEAHPWQDAIAPWLEGRDDVSVNDVLTNCLDKKIGDCKQADKAAVGAALKALGFERKNARTESGREWRYKRAA